MGIAQQWFHSQEFNEQLNVQPHPSINIDQFYEHVHRFPEWWQSVFEFLKSDLSSLKPGRYSLVGDQVFAMISTYETKTKADSKWEAHRQFIDLQLVLDGSEMMGLLPLNKAVKPEEYDEAKDLQFFEEQPGEYFQAAPNYFFVFFPEDVHRPGLQVEGATSVKKLVIKLAVSNE